MTESIELPPNPYEALGVSKDADDATIKSAYRKLVLKWHPDKITDPAEKQRGSDRFHLIQTSYERLSNPASRRRYDLEVELAEAKKARASHRSATEPAVKHHYRSASAQEVPRSTYERRASEKVAPIYEERRPAYADYAEPPPKPTRKEYDQPRPSRRPSHDTKEKARAQTKDPKETERAERLKKARQTTKDTKRERDSKYGRTIVEASSEETDSDAYIHDTRKLREDREDRRRDDRRRTKEVYPEQVRRATVEPEVKSYFDERVFDERTKKLSAQHESARDYIGRASRARETSDARPTSSQRDYEFEQGPRGEERPSYPYRPGPMKRQPSTRERESMPRSMQQPRERYSSTEETSRYRPATLNASRSSPADIRIPNEKPRAQSLQHDAIPVEPTPIKRSTTMPMSDSRSRYDKPQRGTEVHEGLATPGTTPEYCESPTSRYQYGTQYADDLEYPTTSGMRVADGYHTEVREPPRESRRRETREQYRPTVSRRITRSPSPMKDVRESREGRDRRSVSTKHTERPAPTPLVSRSTSHRYEKRPGASETTTGRSRTSTLREGSYRGDTLYGEIRTEDRYPSQSSRSDDYRVPSGYYSRRSDMDRPGYGRNNSSAIHA